MMKSVVIIPTYNEKDTIESIISSILSNVIDKDIDICVVDDNSPDGTANIVKRLMENNKNIFLINREKKEGLGKAYVYAFSKILEKNIYDTVITMDADMSHDPVYINKMIDLRKEYDIVIGSRYVKGGKTFGWEKWRMLLSYFGNLYTKTVLKVPVNDLTAGYNAISTNILKKVDLNKMSSSGYAYTIESKFMFYKNGAKMIEVPIIFRNRIHGESKISNHIIREGILAPWRLILK